jgi:hypothetical protein
VKVQTGEYVSGRDFVPHVFGLRVTSKNRYRLETATAL